MKNYLLQISYNGSAYHGWQVQDNAVTVQEKLQDSIEAVFGKREDVKGCSRTDSGVHANKFCCSFKSEREIPVERIPSALNTNLPLNIAVEKCTEMPLSFHARYDCKGKEYVYKIWNASERNPFYNNLYYHYKFNLDAKLLDKEAKAFIGEHDFSSFCSTGGSVEDKVRTIYDFRVERHDNEVFFIVSGNGFLYNMVRIMVGTLLEISSGKIGQGKIDEIIAAKDRNNAGFTVPPQGLYLNDVYY